MNNTQPHILVVDDDAEIRDLLGKFLEEHGFTTTLARDGEEMTKVLNDHPYDLVILDLMLPGEDGLSLCRKIRNQSALPIIMVTAAGEEVDRIIGLEMGADDYVSKPFNPRELLARVRAILRRSGHHQKEEDQNSPTCELFKFANWTLDRTRRRLISPDDVEITLSAGEFELLVALVEQPQKVLSRDQLSEITKNREASPFDRSIDIQISRIRRKIEPDPKKPTLIKTVRGGGYVLACLVTRTEQRIE